MESFDAYYGPIKSTYSQVWWTSASDDLPDDVVKKFDGKVIAIVGMEARPPLLCLFSVSVSSLIFWRTSTVWNVLLVRRRGFDRRGWIYFGRCQVATTLPSPPALLFSNHFFFFVPSFRLSFPDCSATLMSRCSTDGPSAQNSRRRCTRPDQHCIQPSPQHDDHRQGHFDAEGGDGGPPGGCGRPARIHEDVGRDARVVACRAHPLGHRDVSARACFTCRTQVAELRSLHAHEGGTLRQLRVH